MERATIGLGTDGQRGLPSGFDPRVPGPLDRDTAVALLRQADDLLEAGEPQQALARYGRVVGQADRDVSAAALFGLGNALYRVDRDDEALSAWEQAASLGETPVAYRAWRQVAAGRVRAGNLPGALDAYRQCERRAPREDRAEIASRLGWLSKETGNARAAGRYFARSRGDVLPPFMTFLVIAVTSIVSFVAMGQRPLNFVGGQLENDLALIKPLVAQGEYYRLFTVTLVHDPSNILHLLFNMYALYFAGVIVERMYGSVLFALFYFLAALAGSVASFVFSSSPATVGASGAIFGLFGVIFIAMRAHHPVLDRQSRGVTGQIGALIVLNLVIGFSGVMPIDNAAHVGGLVAGLWLGFLIPPGQVPTLASFWQSPRARQIAGPSLVAVRAVGVLALVAVIGAGVVVGSDTWAPQRSAPPGSSAIVAAAAPATAGSAVGVRPAAP